MTRDDLRAAVHALYQAVGENDVKLGQRLGVNNVTARRWRTETFSPTAESAVLIAREARLNPYEALRAVGREDLAAFLLEAAASSGTKSEGDARLSPPETFLVSYYRGLAPEEAAALVLYVETQAKARKMSDAVPVPRVVRPRRRRS